MEHTQKPRSLGELICFSCEKWASKTAALYTIDGKFESITYRDFQQRIFQFAGALHHLGLKKGDCLALIAENCLEWAILDWAAQTLGIILVPIYPTLPKEQVSYIIKDSGSIILIAGTHLLADKAKDIPDLNIILLKKEEGYAALEDLAISKDFTFDYWRENVGQVSPYDIATYIYTSGTTGEPKGVMLTHHSFVYLAEHVVKFPFALDKDQQFILDEKDVFLSFLPLSHIFERMGGHILPYSIGATVGYVQSVASFAKDMLFVKPTVMLSVPRILESMHDRILDQVSRQTPMRKKLFFFALHQGLLKAKGQFAPFFFLTDKLVGKKIRERTGGRLKYLISGGAALSEELGMFYQAFGLDLFEGYGLTETCAMTTCNFPGKKKFGTVGIPLEGIEIKIAEDGEILVRGPSIMKGYYHLDEATHEAIDSDGWFYTGDIGMFDGDFLKITDRKKNIIVLGNGKNVAPQPIENKLKSSPWIEESVLLGDGMEHICALIVPNFEKLEHFAKEEGFLDVPLTQLVHEQKIRKLYKSQIDEVNASLASFEKIKKFELLTQSFSIEKGELTPSLKVKRKIVSEKYQDLIRSMQRPH